MITCMLWNGSLHYIYKGFLCTFSAWGPTLASLAEPTPPYQQGCCAQPWSYPGLRRSWPSTCLTSSSLSWPEPGLLPTGGSCHSLIHEILPCVAGISGERGPSFSNFRRFSSSCYPHFGIRLRVGYFAGFVIEAAIFDPGSLINTGVIKEDGRDTLVKERLVWYWDVVSFEAMFFDCFAHFCWIWAASDPAPDLIDA